MKVCKKRVKTNDVYSKPIKCCSGNTSISDDEDAITDFGQNTSQVETHITATRLCCVYAKNEQTQAISDNEKVITGSVSKAEPDACTVHNVPSYANA